MITYIYVYIYIPRVTLFVLHYHSPAVKKCNLTFEPTHLNRLKYSGSSSWTEYIALAGLQQWKRPVLLDTSFSYELEREQNPWYSKHRITVARKDRCDGVLLG
jgi:hypothetical protein